LSYMSFAAGLESSSIFWDASGSRFPGSRFPANLILEAFGGGSTSEWGGVGSEYNGSHRSDGFVDERSTSAIAALVSREVMSIGANSNSIVMILEADCVT
jgi:hypothetical protein